MEQSYRAIVKGRSKPNFYIGLQNTLSLQLSIKSPASHGFFDKEISKDISQIDYICLFLVLPMHFRVIIWQNDV